MDPEWYYESHDLGWWLSDLFSTMVEVHAFQLGVLVGILFAVAVAREYPKVSLVVLVLAISVLFSGVDFPLLCGQRTESCAHVRLKPWYFLTGMLCAHIGTLAVSTISPVSTLAGLVQRLRSEESEP